MVTVESISDGDTLRVTLGEVSTRVRLLNIDTPETRHPSKPVECMGPEATAALKSMISPGDTVVLRYDRRLYDRYDRLLAGVYADGVLVNAVAPGIIASPMAAEAFDAETVKRLVPMKRAGKPEEVAELVGFLASENAAYISGQVISINGAMI